MGFPTAQVSRTSQQDKQGLRAGGVCCGLLYPSPSYQMGQFPSLQMFKAKPET